MKDTTLVLLQAALQVSVPLYIARLVHEPWSRVAQRARECAQVVASQGDVILYRSRRQGQTAGAFNHLAEGLACVAFCPGGVTIFDLHFEAKHPDVTTTDPLDVAWFTSIYERMIYQENP